MKEYVTEILVPFFEGVRLQEGLPENHPALCILDIFKAHTVESVKSLFADHNIRLVFVPANCTGDLQPLDASGNGDFKAALRAEFISWYAAKVAEGDDDALPNINLSLSAMKPLHARWLVKAWEALRDNSNAIINGWVKTGIKGALEIEDH